MVLLGLVRQMVYNRALAPVEVEGGMEWNVAAAGIPKKLVIGDKVDISLDEAVLTGKVWQVSPTNGSYLMNSARLGKVGNMIIYGHNRKPILGNLKQVKVGEEIKLFDVMGKEWPYRVVKTVVVNPKDTSWLQETDIPTLTVYTCTGLLDSQRLIVRAVPVGKNY